MRFISSIELDNYLNIKHARLVDLKDLNIIIGPNNCGKTSLLRAVQMLSRINFGRHNQPLNCPICINCFNADSSISSIDCSIDTREKYLAKTDVGAIFCFNKSEIEKILPEFSQREENLLNSAVGHMKDDQSVKTHLKDEFDKERLVVKEHPNRQLRIQHISPIIWNEVKTKILNHILFCPDERLQTYKGTQIPDHIKSKNFDMDEFNKLIEFLEEVVDPRISSMRHSLDLVREVETQRFNTSIAEQGSGVKSLICLMADIISAVETKILLIDEPELGLNPSGKHAFLKFLIQQAQNKQIFLATHDPTFVNPYFGSEKMSQFIFTQ